MCDLIQHLRKQIDVQDKLLQDQGDLIKKLARGMRLSFQELQKDLPDINRAMDHLDEHYVGGRGNIIKAVNGRSGMV